MSRVALRPCQIPGTHFWVIVFTMSTEQNGVAFSFPRNTTHIVVVPLLFRHSRVSILESLATRNWRFPSPFMQLHLVYIHTHTTGHLRRSITRSSQIPPEVHLLLAFRCLCPPRRLDAVRDVSHSQMFHPAHPIVDPVPGAPAFLTPVTAAAALVCSAPLAYRTATLSWCRYRAPLLLFRCERLLLLS